MFKCPLGDCISKENCAYVGLTTTALSRWLTMHLNDSSPIALNLFFFGYGRILSEIHWPHLDSVS